MSVFWMETIKASILKRNRRSITIPAFAVRCGEQRGSMDFNPRTATGTPTVGRISDSYSLKSAFTVEMWLKTYSQHNTGFSVEGQLFGNRRTINADYNIQIFLADGKINVVLLKTASTNLYTSTRMYPIGDWFHLAVVYGSSNLILYINGVPETLGTLAPNLDTATANNYTEYFGNTLDGLSPYVGLMAEPRVWNVALTGAQIRWGMDKYRGFESGLITYLKFNETQVGSSSANFKEKITDTTLTYNPNSSAISFDSESYPPIIYGSSFVAARFPVEVGFKSAFKFPTNIPSGANFMLVVSYLDATDPTIVRRYKLWDCDGVTIWPALERYRGFTLPESFWLEAWNIDGDDNATMADDLVVYSSKADIPQNMNDQAAQTLASTEIDISLGEPFPVVFPADFDTEIWGTVADPVTQPVGVFSTNIPVRGNTQ